MTDYDVVIAGAGPVGAILARRLTRAGVSVLVLEAGAATGATWEGYQGNVLTHQSAIAKVPNSPWPDSPFAPEPSVLDIAKIPPGGVDANHYLVQAGPMPFGSDYTKTSGGTTMHWLGTSLRMVPADFELRSRYGQGVDWPLSYDDLEPYYRQAELELGIAANVEDQRYLGIWFPDDYVYPMFRIPPSFSDQVFAAQLDGYTISLDGTTCALQVTSTPQGRNSMPNPAYDGGRGYEPLGAVGNPHRGLRCEGNASCIPICPVQAKYNALKTLAAAAAERMDLVTQAVVSKVLLTSDAKRVSGLVYQTYDGSGPGSTPVTVTADVYVLATSAIENAKILLASNAANSSGQVGLNLMDHPFVMTWALMGENIGAYRGPGSTSGIEILRDGAFRKDRAAFRVELANWGWDFPAFGPYLQLEEAVAGGAFGPRLRQQMAEDVPRQIRFGFVTEQLPSPANRVEISNAWTDALGNPRPVIHYQLDDYVLKSFKAARQLSSQAFSRLGAIEMTSYSPLSPTWITYDGQGYSWNGAGHVMGTHRMWDRADQGVVDPDQRSFDHDNLFVAGGGSMPTSSAANPTLTIAALACRTADRITADLGRKAS